VDCSLDRFWATASQLCGKVLSENYYQKETTMRFLPLLLLLPALALAQPSAGQMDQQQMFDQTKKMMLSMTEETLPAMQESYSCLKAADDQAAFEECAQIMIELNKKMMARMGPMHGAPEGQAPQMKDPSEIEWNQETKDNMLKFLDRSIMVGTAMQDCLKQSSDLQQMQQCMQSKRPTP
jgi:hypothetical protein